MTILLSSCFTLLGRGSAFWAGRTGGEGTGQRNLEQSVEAWRGVRLAVQGSEVLAPDPEACQ